MSFFIKTKFGISVIGIVAGVFLLSGFTITLEATNTQEFCISCHSMKNTVYQEYKDTVHYNNRTGVRTTCVDCHVPKELGPKLVRKLWAVNDLYHTVLGSIDTQEKFDNKRLHLAQRVWDYMKQSNSRECRSCHSFKAMEFDEQAGRSSRKHSTAIKRGQTCIDCHKGIAHELPEDYEPDADGEEQS